MTNFEKFLKVYIYPQFKKEYLTEEYGFVDMFTHDEDKPVYEDSLYLMFKPVKQTEKTIKMYRNLSLEGWVKKEYVKIIKNKPYYIFQLYVPTKYHDWFCHSDTSLSGHRYNITKYWGVEDDFTKFSLLNNFVEKEDHFVPLEDGIEEPLSSIEINKGDLS